MRRNDRSTRWLTYLGRGGKNLVGQPSGEWLQEDAAYLPRPRRDGGAAANSATVGRYTTSARSRMDTRRVPLWISTMSALW